MAEVKMRREYVALESCQPPAAITGQLDLKKLGPLSNRVRLRVEAGADTKKRWMEMVLNREGESS